MDGYEENLSIVSGENLDEEFVQCIDDDIRDMLAYYGML